MTMPLDKPYKNVPGTTIFDAEQSRKRRVDLDLSGFSILGNRDGHGHSHDYRFQVGKPGSQLGILLLQAINVV